MLLYYSWLPIELEREYFNGFYCDDCGSEFFKGPLYHNESSKRDLCINCGTTAGYSVFQGMIAALFFPSEESCIFDEELSSVPMFVFQLSSASYGVLFSCGSNLLFTFDGSPGSFVLHEKEGGRKINLAKDLATQRFSWLRKDFRITFNREVRFHPAPSLPNNEHLLIERFTCFKNKIVLELSSNIRQLLFCELGAECILYKDHIISYFRSCAPVLVEKKDFLKYK